MELVSHRQGKDHCADPASAGIQSAKPHGPRKASAGEGNFGCLEPADGHRKTPARPGTEDAFGLGDRSRHRACLRPSPGKGTFLFLLAGFENIAAGFGALGAIGKRAEEVADDACSDLFDYLNADGALDPHLADQIVPYLALARGPSRFSTSRITKHLLTNIWVIRQFLDAEIEVSGAEGERGTVKVEFPS